MSAAKTTPTVRGRTGSTRARIMAEAAALFAERGFAAVSVSEIAERTGVSAGAIYRHFPSKEAVLESVLLDSIDAWLRAAAAGAAADPAVPPVRRVVAASVQLVLDRPGELAAYLRERPRVDAGTRRELARRESALFDRWTDAIRAARPELSRAEIAVRQQAVNGVLSSLARRPEGLGQSRLRALVTDGLVAVVTAAAPAPAPPAGAPRRAWSPPVPRREQVIDVAMGLFAERGYHGVGMDDIGDALGMSGPSLYEYVASKADILLDAFDRAGAFVVAGAAAALAAATSASDALDRLTRSYVEVAFDHVDLVAVTSREGTALAPSERPRLARRRRDIHDQWTAVLREVRDGLGPTEGRVLTRSALALVAALARHRRDGHPSVAAATTLVRAFLLGTAPNITTEEHT